MNILDFKNYKASGKKISMVTCYDNWSAKILNETPVDCILVGDSLAMVMHGYETTLNATMNLMEIHTQAVTKGAPNKFVVADMPFLSFRKGIINGVRDAGKLMQAGASAVKIEGAKGNLDLIKHLVESGIPVMGHLGLTPQSIHALGGFRVQGKTNSEYKQIIEDSLSLEKAGCFSLVLECVPANLAAEITKTIRIPTIGIGAGLEVDGQVLVLQDLLGMNDSFNPKFLRKFLDGKKLIQDAITDFHNEVSEKTFPTEKESYL